MPKLYDELARWWPLLSPPSDYEEEAAFFAQHLQAAGDQPCESLLELGSGGGNNASFMKAHFKMVLADPAPGMLAVSRALNPDCEHIQGDMRSLRLGCQFDRVFIHDAICYMATEPDLRRAIETAFIHCRPGGAALFAPDHVRENFRPTTDYGGTDDGVRGLRFLEWTPDPGPGATAYTVDYVYLLREDDGSVRVEHDRHIEGLFPRATWLKILADVGFEGRVAPFVHSQVEPDSHEIFIGERPA